MHLVCVHVYVKAEHRDAFIQATLDNARNSTQEPGNLRFDVLQQADDPNRFMLYEVYQDAAAADAHKQTAHYARWRDTVMDWMLEPRKGVRHVVLAPTEPEHWATRR
jgi:(4S)-4-hydroxy-5-phosphonooxypentane-2,3-dione isomerase